ncbi:MBL fold metallo-hydrolase [Roseovarius arcticus]|uniref:MBL fold metallo-hydrolase n=1 Tax=Roseovarius arcticus TaxID=2547404 RepID=UPI0011108778|nr:MBL fold metallo-hydrolase [Roseovarius arcticus]
MTLLRLKPDAPWFSTTEVTDNIQCLSEPYVIKFMQSNIWFLRGRDADLLVDTGNGIVPLLPELSVEDLTRLIVVATHAHADHVGGLVEFPGIWCNTNIVEALKTADPNETLAGPGYALDDISAMIVPAPNLSGPLVTMQPNKFDPAQFGPQPATVSRALVEGDTISLGDRIFDVLEVPGHSPACIALYDAQNRLLITGDAIYDGMLVDGLFHSNRATYRRSLKRLLTLPVDLALGGHGQPMTGDRMRHLIQVYLAG